MVICLSARILLLCVMAALNISCSAAPPLSMSVTFAGPVAFGGAAAAGTAVDPPLAAGWAVAAVVGLAADPPDGAAVGFAAAVGEDEEAGPQAARSAVPRAPRAPTLSNSRRLVSLRVCIAISFTPISDEFLVTSHIAR